MTTLWFLSLFSRSCYDLNIASTEHRIFCFAVGLQYTLCMKLLIVGYRIQLCISLGDLCVIIFILFRDEKSPPVRPTYLENIDRGPFGMESGLNSSKLSTKRDKGKQYAARGHTQYTIYEVAYGYDLRKTRSAGIAQTSYCIHIMHFYVLDKHSR